MERRIENDSMLKFEIKAENQGKRANRVRS